MNVHSLQPTLIKHNSSLSIYASKGEHILVKVLDIEGKIAKTVTHILEEGKQELSLNLSDLSKGKYVLNAFSKDVFLNSFKFVKH
ncbi:MAG: hypothetical protein ACOVMM_10555 [Chitinophagaceae bacterium]